MAKTKFNVHKSKINVHKARICHSPFVSQVCGMKTKFNVHKTVAIIPAGGTGRRMGGSISKQYLLLSGKPVLVRALQPFQDSPLIDEIMLAVPEEDVVQVRENIVERYFLSKLNRVVAGGKERQDSIRNALACIADETEIIVIHDGVRPLVTTELIEMAIERAGKLGAVATGIGIRDTVKRVDKTGKIEETVLRDGLWLTQTPQAFKRDILLAAYRVAEETGFYGTDDASLVEKAGIPVWMIPGDRENLKVTTQEDMMICARILQYREKDLSDIRRI
ncbi:MAG: 2-C-methyl-D-erythritol 4-phosphate cytidylyltransferase [Syntrophales bacterium]|jgi:2-C-methyl-D-erythritol 4-phosphate cytidylyltransferase|nr:2-C-methyl-D-erythritol 4-phosphate cytidylyltransferase [Syntrophales bacterium]